MRDRVLRGVLSETKSLKGTLIAPSKNTINIMAGANVNETNYERLKNKPSIEGVQLIGDKTFEELGLENIDNLELMGLLTF